MPRRLPLPFGFDASPAQHQGAALRRCVNLRTDPLPENSKAPLAAYRMEGLDNVFTVSPPGTIRGMLTMRGVVYYVVDTKLYSWVAPSTLVELGSITGTGRVSMAGNGDELVVVNAAGTKYRWDGSSVTLISDPDLPTLAWVESFDQYIVYGRLDGEGWGVSALNDAGSYDALDVTSAESDPDPIVMGIRVQREMYILGKDTIEIFYVSQNGAEFPFQRAPDGVVEVGLAAKWSCAKVDNTLFFLANEKGGLSVRKFAGRTPVRVSTPEIDNLLDGIAAGTASDVSNAYALSYTLSGHAYYVLHIPARALTLQYDCLSQKWQQRESAPGVPWRVGFAVSAYGQLYFGETLTGRVLIPNRETHTEFGNALHWETVCAPAYFQGRNLTFAAVELDLDRTQSSKVRTVTLSWSDDDGVSWSAEQSRSTSTYSKAPPRLRWTNLGSSRSRLFKFKGQSAQPMALIQAYADVEVGA